SCHVLRPIEVDADVPDVLYPEDRLSRRDDRSRIDVPRRHESVDWGGQARVAQLRLQVAQLSLCRARGGAERGEVLFVRGTLRRIRLRVFQGRSSLLDLGIGGGNIGLALCRYNT